MKKKYPCKFKWAFALLILTFFSYPVIPGETITELPIKKIVTNVRQLMEKGKIPGLSLVIVKENAVYMKGFGYANLEEKVPVTPGTLFELASCSKAFTGLAALKLAQQGLLHLDDPVSHYLPWFYVTRDNQKRRVTLRQALHHTTGIPSETLNRIPRGNAPDALEQTVRNLAGIEIDREPGTRYEYATINYDIIGAVIEKAAGMPYEDYMIKNIFRPLGLTSTTVGPDRVSPTAAKAAGYKIGFFKPGKYKPPLFRGNNPAGYIMSNGKDMARWLTLQIQPAKLNKNFAPLIHASHQPDRSVRPQTGALTSYAMGWQVNQYENEDIFHAGLNPNFTAYIHFSPREKTGVVLLANSNSRATTFIGRTIMHLLRGQDLPTGHSFEDATDKAGSVISILLAIALLVILLFLVSIIIDLSKGRRHMEPLTWKKTIKVIVFPIMLTPILLGIYLLPGAMAGVTWETALVWSPTSFQAAVLLLLICIGAGYLGYILSLFFPHKNKYFKSMPLLAVLSLLTGGANAVVIFLITSSLYSRTGLIYQLYFFGLAIIIYIWGRKLVQTRLIKITQDIVYDLRIKLTRKVFQTSYERFEMIDRGRVYATLNNDTSQIGGTANMIVRLITSFITAIGAFLYLAAIAFWATMVTLTVVLVIAGLYYIVGQHANRYMNEARDAQNVYMRLINGLIDGFKELSLHLKKKNEYNNDIKDNCEEFRQSSKTAGIKFLHAFLIGESLLIFVLGAVCFAVPRLFPGITSYTLMSFIMVLLYLIGPINAILNTIPGMVQLKIAWERIQEFIKDIPANIPSRELAPVHNADHKENIQYIKAKGLMFQYKNPDDEDEEDEEEPDREKSFSIGPIDFEARKGEVIFIVGGNGSGKTTLGKVLTGLYPAARGTVEINGKEVSHHKLGEYFSAVFSDYHLFEKIYAVDLSKKAKEAHHYLKLLRLEEIVEYVGNSYSTIDLSGGQRKRLALLQCCLEDCPIFIFDEVAADQDPTFRKFFYRELLQQMREQGKIVIAITHDDHYFDAADRVIKMDMGKIQSIS